MNIGILGTGKVARALAEAWSNAGHHVTFGSRQPTGDDIDHPVVSLSEAIRGADVVVNAILGMFALDTISELDPELFTDKTLIDVANAVSPTLALTYPDTSLGQELQLLLPAAHVVKTLNTAAISVTTAPGALAGTTLFLSGDDAGAKTHASRLVRDLGWPGESLVDLGGIETAHAAEHYFLMFITLAQALGSETFNIQLLH